MKKLLFIFSLLFVATMVFAEENSGTEIDETYEDSNGNTYTVKEITVDENSEKRTRNGINFDLYTSIEGGYTFLTNTACRGGSATFVAGIQPFIDVDIPAIREMAVEFDLIVESVENRGQTLTMIVPTIGAFDFIGFGDYIWTLDLGCNFGWTFFPGATNLPMLVPGEIISFVIRIGPSFHFTENIDVFCYYNVLTNIASNIILNIDTTGGISASETIAVGVRYRFPISL